MNNLDSIKLSHILFVKTSSFGYSLLENTKTGLFFIIKPIIETARFTNKWKNLIKPNFSYYCSYESIEVASPKNDDRLLGFPDSGITFLEDDNEISDAELLLLDKTINIRMAKKILDVLSSSEFNSNNETMFDILKELEDIFGLIYKNPKKEQLGIIGELLVIYNNNAYKDILIKALHNSNQKDKRYDSICDFLIENPTGNITLEVKTTSNDSKEFTIKDEQNNYKVNDYYVAVYIKKVEKSGITVKTLIEWYLKESTEINFYNKNLLDYLSKCDDRFLVRFDPDSVVIKFIKISDVPKLTSNDSRISDISYKIKLLDLEEVELKELLNPKLH